MRWRVLGVVLWLATLGVAIAGFVGISSEPCAKSLPSWRWIPLGLVAAAAIFASGRKRGARALVAVCVAILAGVTISGIEYVALDVNRSSQCAG